MSSPHITLWDDKEYDCEMLRAQYPELLVYAQKNFLLREETPHEIRRRDEGLSLILQLILCYFFGALFAFTVFIEHGWKPAIVFALITLLLPYPILASRRFGTRRHKDWIEVANGIIRVRYGDSLFAKSAPLHDCHWYLGPISDCPRNRQSIHDQTVLIVLPSRWFWRKPIRFACGWTEETRIVWQQFLQLANISSLEQQKLFTHRDIL